jgi:hypothetical protein
VKSEPELRIETWRDVFVGLPLAWLLSLLMPLRSRRGVATATKRSIASRIMSIKSIEVEVTRR